MKFIAALATILFSATVCGTSSEVPGGAEPVEVTTNVEATTTTEAKAVETTTTTEAAAVGALRVEPESDEDGDGRLFFSTVLDYKFAEECPADNVTPPDVRDRTVELLNLDGEPITVGDIFTPTFDVVAEFDDGCETATAILGFVDQLSNEMTLNIGAESFPLSIEQLVQSQDPGNRYRVN